MIHFAIGTKAQFIKMAPLMHLLEQEGEPYHLLDLSQHGDLTGKILADFSLQPRMTRVGKPGVSVTTYRQAISWSLGILRYTLWNRQRLKQSLFMNDEGVVLLHGDTLSTLLGLRLAKAAQLPTGLVEAGLTSGRLFNPFPEEWIRRYTGRRTDYLFAPDGNAESWLRRHYTDRCIINTSYNTGRDALELIASRFPAGNSINDSTYGIVTLHRLETIAHRQRTERAIKHTLAIARLMGHRIRFYMHPPTEKALTRFRLLDLLRTDDVEIRGLEAYPEFVRALSQARFILTDGGSIQEEAAYLNKPCIVLRDTTERNEGIGANVALTTWNADLDSAHLQTFSGTPNRADFRPSLTASKRILDALASFRVHHRHN